MMMVFVLSPWDFKKYEPLIVVFTRMSQTRTGCEMSMTTCVQLWFDDPLVTTDYIHDSTWSQPLVISSKTPLPQAPQDWVWERAALINSTFMCPTPWPPHCLLSFTQGHHVARRTALLTETHPLQLSLFSGGHYCANTLLRQFVLLGLREVSVSAALVQAPWCVCWSPCATSTFWHHGRPPLSLTPGPLSPRMQHVQPWSQCGVRRSQSQMIMGIRAFLTDKGTRQITRNILHTFFCSLSFICFLFSLVLPPCPLYPPPLSLGCELCQGPGVRWTISHEERGPDS